MFRILLCMFALATPKTDVQRDGKVFTLMASMDIERSVEDVWPMLWEFHHLKEYIDNVKSIDSLDGGDNWYKVRYIGDFPFVHIEVTNYKWIMEQGIRVGTKTINHVVESPLPIKVSRTEGCWSLESLGSGRTRLHFLSIVEVDAAGFEGLYTGIAKADGKRILKNFARYVESH
ncbi:SRPBCC family protein [candidate division WOR-3 bacterium]|nr:SRPBCC family protein [candidate division WOR-3 bacterium]